MTGNAHLTNGGNHSKVVLNSSGQFLFLEKNHIQYYFNTEFHCYAIFLVFRSAKFVTSFLFIGGEILDFGGKSPYFWVDCHLFERNRTRNPFSKKSLLIIFHYR